MPLTLSASVKAQQRADSYHSLWYPYLLTTSLLMMILKPLFSLNRVCPVPVSREEKERRFDITGFQRDVPPLSFTVAFIIHWHTVKGKERLNNIWWKGGRGAVIISEVRDIERIE